MTLEPKPSQPGNHLIREKSPYLLQHAYNPVDWFPWGEIAFEKAQRENRPVFLSIGYATCHWCHVMAHESFEDVEVARLLNQSFVSIKVDREERPDIDHIYMGVCQALTGQGGWPLSVFLTPEGNPFFAGTYFPKTSRMGLIGFQELLTRIAQMWAQERDRLRQSGEEIRRAVQREIATGMSVPALDRQLLQKSYGQFLQTFDPIWGGFGKAPKFPTPHQLNFLLRWHQRSRDPQAGSMVEKTLMAMRQGGIFDQIGFGFHRYSVDEKWLVPHFEKMLCDQALLAIAYLEAYQALGQEEYAQTAREIFAYVLRDMTSPEGGFYSAEDADSEGREGLFYLWRPGEVKELLGEDPGGLFCRFYGITEEGNFEGETSIPHSSLPLSTFAEREKMPRDKLAKVLRDCREKLFVAREKRVHPLKDDKILTSWNGLMIAALAKGSQALQDRALAQVASRAADFLLDTMRPSLGRLHRRYRQGQVAHAGFLDDYAYLVWGLIELYEATFQVRYLEEAIDLNQRMIELFDDESRGGFYLTGNDNEALIARPKDTYDGATPSGNSVAALNLVRLARMTGRLKLEGMVDRMLQFFSPYVTPYPMGYTQFLVFLDFVVGPSQEIVIAGDPERKLTQEMIAHIQQKFLPRKVLLFRSEGEEGKRLSSLCPFVEGMKPIENKPAVYLCEGRACKTPLTDLASLESALQEGPAL